MAALIPRFDQLTLIYKTFAGVNFQAAVLIPKKLPANKTSCPLLVHFHGGCLVNGTPLEPNYLSEWPLELSESKGAVLVSPEYRLMPEANGADILEDIGDFLAWMKNVLPTALTSLKPYVTVDLGCVAVTGESAGGYLALQSAFLFPEARIRIAMAQYCGMYPDLLLYPRGPDGQPHAEEEAVLDAYLQQMQPGTVRLSTPFPGLLEVALAHLKTERRQQLFGPDDRLRLDYCLHTAKAIPPLWIAQGTDDHIIPKTATDELVAKIKEARPEVPLLYSVRPGDHGFDSKDKLSDAWLAEAMAFVGQYWP